MLQFTKRSRNESRMRNLYHCRCKVLLSHILFAALFLPGSDGVSVSSLSPSPTTVIVVPPDISSVTLSWNYTLDSGETKLEAIKIERIKGATATNELVNHKSRNPSDPGVKEAFRSRMNFTTSGYKIDLVINNVTVDDGNGFIYQCQVISDQFNSKSARVELVVRVAAHNVATVCGQAILGKAVTCSCTADGAPVPTRFQWRAPNGTLLHNGSSYTTPRVEQSLDGSYYTCVASNGYGPEARRNTTLFNVLVSASITRVTGKNIPVCEGEQVVLSCEVEGRPRPYVVWTRGGSVLQNSTNTSYTIHNVKRGDMGSYTCEATNVAGSTSNTTSIADVQFPAKVVSITANNTYVRNQRVELNCSVEGDPPPYVAWINVTDGSVLQNRTVNTSYVIPSVSSFHKGTYRCVTGNRCGNDSRETSITDVYIKPSITKVIGKDIPVCEGEKVKLTCEVEGYPKPDVVWTRDGRVLQNSTNSSYTIHSVKRGDEGSYTCEAINVAGNTSNTTSIADVQFPAKVVSITANNTYVRNQRVELSCSVEGDPPPYVVWINVTDESVLQNRTVNTSYVIPSVFSLHKGTYRCVAGNRCGNDSKETNITYINDPCQECESKNKLCERREDKVYCKCKLEQAGCTEPLYVTLFDIAVYINTNIVAKRKRRSTKETENLTNVTSAIENFFKTKYENDFLWIHIKNISKAAKSEKTKVVFDVVFKPSTSYSEEQVLAALKEDGSLGSFTVALADPCDPNPCPNARPGCTGTLGTVKYSCPGEKGDPDKSMGTVIAVATAVSVFLVLVIVAVVVWKIKRKRCRKDRKVANGDEHKLEERQLSDPSIEARACGHNNAGHEYLQEGPTITYAQVDKNKKGKKKAEDLYAKVDMSKKSKKKKPGEVMYADLADFQTDAATQSAKPSEGQQPIKKPPQYQSTDYASITDIMKEREGKIEKIPINAPATGSEPPEKPTEEKPVKDDTGTQATHDGQKEKTSTETTGGETANLLTRKGDGDNISKSFEEDDSKL